MANATIVADLILLPSAAWALVRYTDLVSTPKQTIQRIAQFADLRWDDQVEQRVASALPISRMTFSAPAADKWRKHAQQLEPLLPGLEPLIARVEGLLCCH